MALVVDLGPVLGRMTDEQLDVLSYVVDETLIGEKVLKAADAVTVVEADLAKTIVNQWDDDARKATNQAVGVMRRKGEGKISQVTLDRTLRKIDKQMSDGFAAGLASKVRRSALVIYNLGRTGEASRLGLQTSFRVVDRAAVGALSKNYSFWMGEYHGKNISEGLAFTSRKLIVEQGLAGTDAARRFQGIARSYFDGKGFTKFPTGPPPSFHGTPNEYFSGLANHIATQGRVFGRMSTFEQVGITRYRIVAIMDRRTSNICRMMHGQEFAVEQARTTIEAWTGTKDPEDVKDKAGWQRAPAAAKLAGISGYKPGMVSPKISPGGMANLANAGMALPPYHFRCRTDVVSVSTEVITTPTGPAPAVPRPAVKPKPEAKPRPRPGVAVPTAPKVSAFQFEVLARATRKFAGTTGQLTKEAQAEVREQVSRLYDKAGMRHTGAKRTGAKKLVLTEGRGEGLTRIPAVNQYSLETGAIEINREAIEAIAKLNRAGTTAKEARGASTLAHEVGHGYSSVKRSLYYNKAGRIIEEATTELVARSMVPELLPKAKIALKEAMKRGAYSAEIDVLASAQTRAVQDLIKRGIITREQRRELFGKEFLARAARRFKSHPKIFKSTTEMRNAWAQSVVDELPPSVMTKLTTAEVQRVHANFFSEIKSGLTREVKDFSG